MPDRVDLVFLAGNRPGFTALSLQALFDNTNWGLVDRLIVYTDGFQPFDYMADARIRLPWASWAIWTCRSSRLGGPIAIMNDYLLSPAPLWAKIDNDVIVPPGWLDACLETMQAYPHLDLLGIEPPLSRTKAPWPGAKSETPPESMSSRLLCSFTRGRQVGFAQCESIGGIGLFRSSSWLGRLRMIPHSIYGGFTDWQMRSAASVTKGWIFPPLNLFLLDRMPMEPYASMNRKYLAEGQQRPWTLYSDAVAQELAGWWLKDHR